MKYLPFVSVIIPCRNEEKYIERCLDSILQNDYPKENLEVLVIDAMSEDGTRKIILEYSKKYPFIKLLDNPKKYTPFALNIGIKKARNEIIIRMDAHASYEKDYISKCVFYLDKYNADNVGGTLISVPLKNSLTAKAITLSLGSFFGVGNAYYKIGFDKPKRVDTVFGGCYRKEVFDRIGFYNEDFIRSQDIEFNLRLRKSGGKIIMIPDIIAYYYPKSSNFKEFFIHNFKDGIWCTYRLKFLKKIYYPRHYIPLIFVTTLIISAVLSFYFFIFLLLFLGILGFYVLFSFYFALKVAIREKEWRYIFLMFIVFACRHFGYGLGSITGIGKIFCRSAIN